MRTTAKPVIEALQAHILEQFNSYHYESNGTMTELDNLKAQIKAMRYGERTTYQTALDWVEGGGALIYHTDVKEFLNNLGINPTHQEYSDDKSWRLYCHLVAREITKLVEAK